MCGITGWLSFSRQMQQQRDVLQNMTDTMALRGPDAGGLWIDGPVGLGHRRLSVIDLAGGAQPMMAGNRGNLEAVMTYSGEVYNFKELRAELEAAGQRFLSRSDTEVVLRAWLQWGNDFVQRLNGIFAFAIWDIRRQSLLLVRDRMGVKPLYYFPTEDGVIFGSEAKALLANPLVKARVDADGLRELLKLVKTPGQAIFKGIYEVLPGEMIHFSRRGKQYHRYWQLEALEHTDTLEQTIAHTRELLDDIVGRQIAADVPLCSLLSGGLDSFLITALASKKLLSQGRENIRSFSVDFRSHGIDFVKDELRGTPDAPFVRDLVAMIGSQHGEIVLDSRSMADCKLRDKIIRALDLPPVVWGDMWPSLYLLFEAIRHHSTVALSGESADEVFGGYRWFHDAEAVQGQIFPWLAQGSGKYFDGTTLLDASLLQQLHIDEFLHDSFTQAQRETPLLPGESPINQRMRQISHMSLTRFVRSLLDRKDRMSMAVGLEVRVPFCDHRLVEYVFNIPWEMKCFDGREKSILRAAGQDLLPESIVKRVKSPYPSTQDPAYEQALRELTSAIMADKDAPVRALLDDKQVNDKLALPMGSSSSMDIRVGLEMVVGLNRWMENYQVELAL
ncbi:asparagine synthase (glutamine-hydrolyzing) [Erwinia aphidicola]|uniref:asparagine synthase (glutamine-hydrolyzing) n=2 Tax=Erwinia aphidicola TaxID=68334 RepID=UPI0030CC8ABD